MKDAGTCVLDGYDKQEWGTETGKCVLTASLADMENQMFSRNTQL